MSETFEEWYLGYWKIKPDATNPNTYKHQKNIWNHQQQKINDLEKKCEEYREIINRSGYDCKRT